MTIELHSATVQAVGRYGRAARTSAGFVVLCTTDGQDLLDVIADHESSPAMVERLSDEIERLEPAAFTMLFTAGGEPYLLAWGETIASIESSTTRFTIRPSPGCLAIEPLNIDIDADIRLANDSVPSTDRTPKDLTEGRREADAVVVQLNPHPLFAVESATTEPEGLTLAQDRVPVSVGAGQPAADGLRFADDQGETDAAVAPAPSRAVMSAPTIDLTQPEFTQTHPPSATQPVAAGDAAVKAPSASPPVEIELATPPSATSAAPVMVLGVVCQHGHHNHPEARFCSVCGAVMTDQVASVLVSGPRPPLGVLVIDDGSTHSIERDIVIGREPLLVDAVRDGLAEPLSLTDANNSVSRQHARIVLDEWRVVATDLGSSNGTWLNRTVDPEAWNRIGPDEQIELHPGDRLRVGSRVVHVELHHGGTNLR